MADIFDRYVLGRVRDPNRNMKRFVYRTVPYRTVPCRAVPCRAVPCRAVPCRAARIWKVKSNVSSIGPFVRETEPIYANGPRPKLILHKIDKIVAIELNI